MIISFSYGKPSKDFIIYDGDNVITVKRINAYLVDAPDIFVESRQKPLFDIPEIGIDNQPIDDGNYLFKKDEMEEFIKKEPLIRDVVLSSFIIILLIMVMLKTLLKNPYTQAILRELKPCIIGIILATGIYMIMKTLGGQLSSNFS